MQKFEMPKLSVEEFEIEDVIMDVSLTEGDEDLGENELPGDGWN